jgi:hypothetical protein
MRLYCLISAFGAPLDNVSAGENELRVLGEVMRLFHESPVLDTSEILVGDQQAGEGENFRFRRVPWACRCTRAKRRQWRPKPKNRTKRAFSPALLHFCQPRDTSALKRRLRR